MPMYLHPIMGSTTESEYIPGTCNIGPQEISNRYQVGYTGLVLALVLILLVEILDGHRLWRLAIIGPVALSLTGFVQATQRFCLAYGFSGVFSVKGFRQLTKIQDDAFLKQDRKMAIRLVAIVGFGTGIITMLYYLLPGL